MFQQSDWGSRRNKADIEEQHAGGIKVACVGMAASKCHKRNLDPCQRPKLPRSIGEHSRLGSKARTEIGSF